MSSVVNLPENIRDRELNMATEKGYFQFSGAAEPIAIVSAACRLPGHVNSPHRLWELLQAGGIAVSNVVPKSRFHSDGHFDGSGKPGTLKALSGMFIEDVDPATFDAPFFNLTRADAIAMDPQQRQLFEVIYECFENGGIQLERISGEEIGCFVGSYTVDYHDIQNRSPEQRPPGMTVGIGRAMLSNRISHFFNLKGSSLTIDSACSSGLVGVDIACQALRVRKLSGAVVAAANLWMSPEHLQEMGTMRTAYSPSGRCHTFDAKADGYCRAEAVNAVFLKRFSDAVRDGDPIRAVIRGTANNSDGWTPGINSPSSEAQAAVIRAAYNDAGLNSSQYAETGFLECHGTGTPAGDVIEAQGAAAVLGQIRSQATPLIIGSVKSNIGHSEPGAGISGLIKAMFAVEQGTIPGNPTFITPNPKIDFENLNLRPIQRNIAWPKGLNEYRRASVNSFGYGGSNAHAVLENVEHFIQHSGIMTKMPQPHISSYKRPADILSLPVGRAVRTPNNYKPRPCVLVFSANDQDSLRRQIEALSAHLLDPRVSIKLFDLSYTLSERRSRHFCRAFLLSHPTKAGLANRIETSKAQFAKTPQEAIKIGLVFTGQGAQWSKMGAELVRLFPETVKPLLQVLDRVLQELPAGRKPAWSLLEELTEDRSPEHISKPEYSQPLVTALQLAQLSVLDSWNINADVVVGHSSGEIAAACSAGFLTPQQAILVAYFRGLAAQQAVLASPMGMMAVGLGAEALEKYLDNDSVVIACYNSPASVTVSGPSASLAELKETLKSDGHFARLLQVELAYHSYHMSEIADRYEKLLVEHGRLAETDPEEGLRMKHMVSTVTGAVLTKAEARSVAYWKANMMSPVRFEGACEAILGDKALSHGVLIELGPSNTLSAPVAQIAQKEGLDRVTYTSANKRGREESINALFDVAGKLFLHGADISLRDVNVDETTEIATRPAFIIDLPNYKWNHSTQYWHESLASKDWRFRKFPEHDLLGSKVLGTLWKSPSWHKTLHLSDLPWLRDHKIGSEILFPAAGYITMAMEAIRQSMILTAPSEEMAVLKAKKYHYRLRNVQFPRGLVLEDNSDLSIMLLLAPLDKLDQGWWEFKIMSSPDSTTASSPQSAGDWHLNSNGLIRLDFDKDILPQPPEGVCDLPLKYCSPGELWYKAMSDAGYSYGPEFRKQLSVECLEGLASSRALISLQPPRSKWEPQSEYPIHPAPLDSCIQSVFPSFHGGNRSNFEKVLLPASIQSLAISGQIWSDNEAISVAASRNGKSDASVYETASKVQILELLGLKFSTMDVQDSIYLSHTYARLAWGPDFMHMDTDEKLQKALLRGDQHAKSNIQGLLDVAAHKMPNMRILEFNLIPGNSESLWLSADSTTNIIRSAVREFHFASDNANTVLAAQQEHSDSSSTQIAYFSLLDPYSATFSPPSKLSKFDLVVVRCLYLTSAPRFKELASNVRKLLVEGGSVIFHDSSRSRSSSSEEGVDIEGTLETARFHKLRQTFDGRFTVAEAAPESPRNTDDDLAIPSGKKDVAIVRLSSNRYPIISEIVLRLRNAGWVISELDFGLGLGSTLPDLPPKSTVVVLDELCLPILATATEEQWTVVQTIVQKECDLLWVTQGSQIYATDPFKAVCHGVFRTVRAEAPMIRIVTLDVESATMANLATNVDAICVALQEISRNTTSSSIEETEFAERDGLLQISRIWPDDLLNQVKREHALNSPATPLRGFHATASTVCPVTERSGNLDALHLVDYGDHNDMQPLEPGEIEVEIATSGCNDSDLGTVSDYPFQFGYEGAGIVVRVGESVTDRQTGQRVAFLCSSSFGDRVIVSSKACLVLPDSMTFQEATTSLAAFLTSIYVLDHMASLRSGQSVLIHLAVGRLGIACIKFCQRISCEVFVTAKSQEEREFLTNELGILEENIFSSQSSAFANDIRTRTAGRGVDVAIDISLRCDLLIESGKLLASGGRLIGLSSRTAGDGESLNMASFPPNCSFQRVNIMTLPGDVIERLFSQLSHLLKDGHIEPISPRKIMGYREIPDALEELSEGAQIGKAVSSMARQTRPRTIKSHSVFDPNYSYFIVGGLRGVCGSLAIHLASNGAKHIAIMSRSSYHDETSQRVALNIASLGCSLDLVRGDVTSIEDVRRCFKEVPNPVGGIIQGAAVFKDRTFESMSHDDYRAALSSKVQGSFNLHTVSIETQQPIAFFTMLSSISGVVGQKGQANYAGGNVFQDALANHRRLLGMPSISIDLGPVEDIGVIQGNDDLQRRFSEGTWFGINEGLLRRIFDYSLLQQHPDPKLRLNIASQAQMITGLAFPQPPDNDLSRDARFDGLRVTSGGEGASTSSGTGKDREIEAFNLLAQSADLDQPALLAAAIVVLGTQLTKQLRLSEEIDSARPLLQYGMDSLASVEFRNWVRATFGIEVTTLDVVNATSLKSLCEKVISKMGLFPKKQ